MPLKKTSRTLEGIVTDLEEDLKNLREFVTNAIDAHQSKINELEIKQLAALRNELRRLEARVKRIEEKLDLQ